MNPVEISSLLESQDTMKERIGGLFLLVGAGISASWILRVIDLSSYELETVGRIALACAFSMVGLFSGFLLGGIYLINDSKQNATEQNWSRRLGVGTAIVVGAPLLSAVMSFGVIVFVSFISAIVGWQPFAAIGTWIVSESTSPWAAGSWIGLAIWLLAIALELIGRWGDR